MLLSANIFQPLISVFEAVLKFFHHSLGVPWGWAIVLLTAAVRLVLVPLMLKQFHSMQAMQAHMPEMKALQAKYKDDKQRQQQEMMKFYSENKINPFASCLPLVAQIPVLIALFYMLQKSLRNDICPSVQTAFRQHYATVHHLAAKSAAVVSQTTQCYTGGQSHGASFLFIHDLTSQATGIALIVLLVLYVGTQMGTQLIMAQPTMDERQRKLMLFLPLVFVVFVFRFPAGVLVYWVTSNSWMLGQQFVFRRRIAYLRAKEEARAEAAGEPMAGAVAKSAFVSPAAKATANASKAASVAKDGSEAGGGGLATLLRGKGKTEPAAAPAGGAGRGGAPPRPPRKKKKRSGRRR